MELQNFTIMGLPETLESFISNLLGLQMRKLRPSEVDIIDQVYLANWLTKQKQEQNSLDY